LGIVAFHNKPLFLGTALLAYTFGLRHAVDADHIAAIDNVTRKLMQEGKRSVSVGFFFALGHSTIVVLASLIRLPGRIGSREMRKKQKRRATTSPSRLTISICFSTADAPR